MWRGRPRPRSHGIICPVKSGSTTDLYRKLPSVDELLRTPAMADLISREGPTAVTESARAVLSRLREEIGTRSEEHTSELQSQSNLVCRLLLEKKKQTL